MNAIRLLGRRRASALVMLASGMLLWPFPVFQILHVESSAIVASVAWFCSGLSATRARTLRAVSMVIVHHLVLLLLPLAALTISVLWAPNCAYLTGLSFYALFAAPSVLMSAGLGHVVAVSGFRARRLTFVTVTMAIVVGGVTYDLYLHPQFFTYNHVFGGVLGPVYDEDLSVRSGLIWFRLLSLFWAVAFVGVAVSVRLHGIVRAARRRLSSGSTERGSRTKERIRMLRTRMQALVVLAAIGIGLIYLFSARLGINTPEWFIEQSLGGHSSSEHFDLYHRAGLPANEARALLATYEYHFHRLSGLLDVAPQERIAVFVYPDPFTRERLTGARYTNVAPVWLPRPQIHVLGDVPERVHAHELVHVFSQEFGLPVINASLAVGLIEGLAVALERPYAGPSPDDQVAAMLDDVRFDVTAVAKRMTPTGFWGGRGAVSYTTAGSFVSFLLAAYPVSNFTAAYSTGRFRRHYGKSVDELADEWEVSLRNRPVVSAFAARTAVHRFSIPSLFEVRCPHFIPAHQRHHIEAQRALARGDTTAAALSLERSLERFPEYAPAAVMLATLEIARGRTGGAVRVLERLPESAQRNLILGDAHAISGDTLAALESYHAAAAMWPRGALDQRGLTSIRVSHVHDPAAVGALYGGRISVEEVPEAATPAGNVLRGMALIQAGEFGKAVEILNGARENLLPHQMDEALWLHDRLRLRLLIRAGLMAERPEVIIEAAHIGAEMAQALGDVEALDYFEHGLNRGRWMERRDEQAAKRASHAITNPEPSRAIAE